MVLESVLVGLKMLSSGPGVSYFCLLQFGSFQSRLSPQGDKLAMIEPNLPVLQFKERRKEVFPVSVNTTLRICAYSLHTAPVPGSVPHFTSIHQMGYHSGVKKIKHQFVLLEFESVNERQTIETWNEKKSSEKKGT